MKRVFLVVTVAVCALSCGGSSSPTQPTPPAPIPAANLGSDGGGAQFTFCAPAPFNTCNFQAGVRNSGPGCAANIRGVVRFLDAGGTQMGASVNWTAPGAVVLLRPNESFTYIAALVPSGMTLASTYRTEANWDKRPLPVT